MTAKNMSRPGGNPDISEIGASYRWKPVAPGEQATPVTLRIPISVLEALDALPGARADKIRLAIDRYLQEIHSKQD